MSIVKDSTSTADLREDFLYHASQAKFYSRQYLDACDEAERMYEKWSENVRYRDEFQKRLWEESPCA